MINNETSSSATKNIASPTYLILLSVLILLALFLLVKFITNYIRSIKKTQKILGNELVIPYVQGFKIASTTFFNIILVNILFIVLIVFSSIMFKNAYVQYNLGNEYSIFYLAAIIVTSLLFLTLNLSIFIVKAIMFNIPQYKSANKLEEELHSLKVSKDANEFVKLPNSFELNDEKMANGILTHRVTSKMIFLYNNLELPRKNQKVFNLKKTYLVYLDLIFKVKLFEEFYSKITEDEAEREALFINSAENISRENEDKLTATEKEIIWMDNADKKADIFSESKKYEEKVGKEEFNKKYLEYLNTVRSQDKNYSTIQKNSWLTYRDNDFEDLFYNPKAMISYYVNGELKEKTLFEFIQEYKKYLITKFYSIIK